jgi:hypothetical protein
MPSEHEALSSNPSKQNKTKQNSDLVFSHLGECEQRGSYSFYSISKHTSVYPLPPQKKTILSMGDAPPRPVKPISRASQVKQCQLLPTELTGSFIHPLEAISEGCIVLGTGGEIKINQTWKQPSRSNSHPSG